MHFEFDSALSASGGASAGSAAFNLTSSSSAQQVQDVPSSPVAVPPLSRPREFAQVSLPKKRGTRKSSSSSRNVMAAAGRHRPNSNIAGSTAGPSTTEDVQGSVTPSSIRRSLPDDVLHCIRAVVAHRRVGFWIANRRAAATKLECWQI